jgi:Tfp pilus assembly protein FimT
MFRPIPPPPRARGFTLFETMLIVLVIAFLSVVAIPPIRRAQEALRFSALAHRVRSELHETRILAISRNEDCRFRVTSAQAYLVECQTPDWVTITGHELPPGYAISATARPEFHPLGNVGPMATIRVTNERGEERRIIVSRSGRVRTE